MKLMQPVFGHVGDRVLLVLGDLVEQEADDLIHGCGKSNRCSHESLSTFVVFR